MDGDYFIKRDLIKYFINGISSFLYGRQVVGPSNLPVVVADFD